MLFPFEPDDRTLYERIGKDFGIEKCVRKHTWFYQPFRREREIGFLGQALKQARSEQDLIHQYDIRVRDLYYHHFRPVAWWVFSNRVKCRDVLAFINEKEQTGYLIKKEL